MTLLGVCMQTGLRRRAEKGTQLHHNALWLLTCRSGFDFTLREVEREGLEDEIRQANADDSIDGMIVYYPVFDSRRDQTLQWMVSMYKDVEGLSPQLISNMYENIRFLDPPVNSRKSILPCTPLAVIKILEYLHIYNPVLDYGKRLFGRRITVINRSEVVGRPLAALLANDGAEVYSIDVTGVQRFSRGSGLKKQKHEVRDMEGWGLEQCLPISDVIISGVPGDAYKVPTDLVREGAVCINFSSEKVCFGFSQGLACIPQTDRVKNFNPDIKDLSLIHISEPTRPY